MKLNFKKLNDFGPTIYNEMVNAKGQKVLFVEHPTHGDEYPVIVMFPDLELAFCSDFFETDDMMGETESYQPWVNENNELMYGYYSDNLIK